MKKIASALCAAALAAVMGGSAFAKSSSKDVQIPFEFSVAKTRMPAGSYRIKQGASNQIAILQNRETGKRVQFMKPVSLAQVKHLVFEQKNGTYVLTELK